MAEDLLVTVTGLDRPGVTAALFGALDPLAVEVLDVEQVVVRGRLLLGVHLRGDAGAQALLAGAVAGAVAPLGVEVTVGPAADAPRRGGPEETLVVTVLGSPTTPGALAAAAEAVAVAGGNIDRIVRLAAWPVSCYELRVVAATAGDAEFPDRLRRSVTAAAGLAGVDVAVQRASLYRRAQRLVVMDVDSTLIRGEVIEMLAAEAGCERQVREVTERAMAGELDFAASLRERVALLAGLDVAALARVRAAVQLTPGAATLVRTLQRLGSRVALVSGGFHEVVDPLAQSLGINLVTANRLEVADGRLTGRVSGEVVDRAAKARALRRFATAERVPLAQTVAVGDGANDLDMLQAAGLGVAFNAKPVVRAAADAAVNVPFLDSVLFLLGISREEVEAADGLDAEAQLAEPDECPRTGSALVGRPLHPRP
ncbi:MAG: phosphoserine phosphatase SerB [Mycobacterium sp.]|nr:phosphoserine phosphatase SerB [Mycobacterium sp.]MCW2744213.1 phosphoserine phosphatase SerB [Mycobacterium sp.]